MKPFVITEEEKKKKKRIKMMREKDGYLSFEVGCFHQISGQLFCSLRKKLSKPTREREIERREARQVSGFPDQSHGPIITFTTTATRQTCV